MIEEPLLLPTSVGMIAGILTLPDTPPVGAVHILPGWACSRADSNQLWTRTARALADVGVASMRADYAGRGESWSADLASRIPAVREVSAWFDERVGRLPTVMVAYCYGMTAGRKVCADRDNIVGTVLVNPPLHRSMFVKRPRPSRARRLRARFGWERARLLPRRVAYRLRYGPAQTWWTERFPMEPALTQLSDYTRHGPSWILVGTNDDCGDLMREVVPQLDHADQVELEVTDLQLLNARTAEAQAAVRDGVVRWVTKCLQAAPA